MSKVQLAADNGRGASFQGVRVKAPKKNTFDLSYGNKLTCNLGQLVPVYFQECVPGDTFKGSASLFVRFAPLASPLMHSLKANIHYFFVPKRLLWDGWEDHITGGPKGDNKDKKGNDVSEVPSFDYRDVISVLSDMREDRIWGQHPWDPEFDKPYHYSFDNVSRVLSNGSLLDYMGCPSFRLEDIEDLCIDLNDHKKSPEADLVSQKVSLLPFRAYQKIYSDYFRDENLEAEINLNEEKFAHELVHPFDSTTGQYNGVDMGSSSKISQYFSEVFEMLRLRGRCYNKDRFTSALPWLQRGGEAGVPLTGDLVMQPVTTQSLTSSISGFMMPIAIGSDGRYYTGTSGQTATIQAGNSPLGFQAVGENSIITINALRLAAKTQNWLENNARGGARYVEQILMHYGIISSDARLQRSEFIGAGQTTVTIDAVTQQSESNETPLGYQAGKAVAVGNDFDFNYSADEHGYIIGILSVVPATSYSQGFNKSMLNLTKFDNYFPEFAGLSEQPIQEKEVCWSPVITDTDIKKYHRIVWPENGQDTGESTFGYTPAYSEMRYNSDGIHGEFKDTLSYWTMSQKYDRIPTLNAGFVHVNDVHSMNADPHDTVVAPFVDTNIEDEHLYVDVFNSVLGIRPLPVYGTPSL